jgi:hypothetical protein
MDEKETAKFLKSMGFAPGALRDTSQDKVGSNKPRLDNRVDKADLLALARKFDVAPGKSAAAAPKEQTLEEFLKKEEGTPTPQ